ncbi:Hypothetical protein R9X50_00189900 [Acrodontium crateriforme]|uniref:Protein YOP1 n=1 Tax=Acrodontium crateriforme TaxID=150365 RepID=A0AAQ3R340_9PEZI|nr:Hypothetical protein R9X50_00189900 [Acrodontium crateriforme]
MFGFIADILTSVTSILFPVFASYKALQSSDPASLTPWLMYWVTLSLVLLVENQFYFVLAWVPFYPWLRLGLHLYLVLPGKQGSVYIYQQYIHPFLSEHEREIDRMITNGHASAKAAGMDVIKRAIEYIRINILGGQARQPTPPPSRNVSYSSYLMDRFAMPAARNSFAGVSTSPSDLFGMLGKALQQNTFPDSTSRDAQAHDLASSGSLIPPALSGEERTDYVNTQRERLRTLLQAFDTEAFNSADAATSGSQPRSGVPRKPTSRKSYLAAQDEYMHRSRSESEFEDLGYEAMPDPDQYRAPSQGHEGSSKAKESGGWGDLIWGNYGAKDSAKDL